MADKSPISTGGFTYANGGSWWTFTTQPAAPEAFGKTAPADLAPDQLTALQLQWESSANATLYEYCIDDEIDGGCDSSWVDASTDLAADLLGLIPGKQYEWQVRASNSTDTIYANDGTWWTFTTVAEYLRLFTAAYEIVTYKIQKTGRKYAPGFFYSSE